MLVVNLDKRVVRAIFILTYAVLIFSVITKLFCIPYIREKFHILGISEYCRIFGIIELLSIGLFLYPKTIGTGLIMLCSYFGGAIATDIHSPAYLYQPIIVLVLVFATAVLRKPSIFHDHIKVEWNKRVKIVFEKF